MSSGQIDLEGRRDRLSEAQALQALQLRERPIEGSLETALLALGAFSSLFRLD